MPAVIMGTCQMAPRRTAATRTDEVHKAAPRWTSRDWQEPRWRIAPRGAGSIFYMASCPTTSRPRAVGISERSHRPARRARAAWSRMAHARRDELIEPTRNRFFLRRRIRLIDMLSSCWLDYRSQEMKTTIKGFHVNATCKWSAFPVLDICLCCYSIRH